MLEFASGRDGVVDGNGISEAPADPNRWAEVNGYGTDYIMQADIKIQSTSSEDPNRTVGPRAMIRSAWYEFTGDYTTDPNTGEPVHPAAAYGEEQEVTSTEWVRIQWTWHFYGPWPFPWLPGATWPASGSLNRDWLWWEIDGVFGDADYWAEDSGAWEYGDEIVLRVDNLTCVGVGVVPEPASAALILIGVPALITRNRYRRRAV